MDTPEVITKYAKEANLTMTLATVKGAGKEKDPSGAYGIVACPTNYLIGADGKVLWRGVGFDEKAMRDALAQAGLK